MHTLRRGSLIASAGIALLTLIGMSGSIRAQGQQIIFSATGDVPYGSSEVAVFQQQMTNHNKYSPSAFLVHVGDILSGGSACNESVYSSVSGIMKSLAVPAYITPGDNETVDCSSPASGFNFFMKYFNNFEQNFCGAPYTERQSARPENWAFVMNGVLFVGINLVYGGTTAQQQAADWVKQQLEAKASEVRAAVVFDHYSPGSRSTFSTPFRQAAAVFAKPVLFLHGHGHSWSMSYPFAEKNILRVQVNKGGSEDPVQVTVTLDNSSPATAFVFERNPWSGKTIVNMPPCVIAGADQAIDLTSTATLQGGANDDGDPAGTLTTTWSFVTGPGAVTFGNPNSLTTTASFSAPGTYVLRLTADDTQLQASDEVTITVQAVGPTLAINDVNLDEGHAGTTDAVFTVSLAASDGSTVTVDYQIVDGTAAAGSDYLSHSGTLTFPAGTTTQTISVVINGDTEVEPDETFFVNLSNPTNATIGDAQGVGTIKNDELSISNDLVGYWRLDEGSGTTAADASGNGNQGTLVGSPTWSTGQFAGALSFDGVDDYVNCGNGASLNITSRITVALWVKSTSLPAQYDALLMKTSSTGWTDGYGLFYNSSNQVRFFVSHYSANVASATISPTQWNHIAGVFDGSSVRIYVNGVEGAADSYTGTITSTTANLEIGRGASNTYNFNGMVDEVRLYNRALSTAEIAALAQPDNTPPTAPGSLTATASGENVNLSWTAANDPESGVTGYKLYRGTSSGGENLLTQIGNVTSYTDAATLPNTTYFYQVSAVNGAGLEGGRSNEASALNGNNAPAAPTGLTATAGNQQVTLDWNNNSEPDLAGYHVYRATVSGGPYTKITSSLATVSAYIDAGLTNGVRYYYVMTAQDQLGVESANSNEANAMPTNVDPSLVGYWKLDEGSGTSAADASGNNNTGTLVGGPTWSTGQFAGALSFDGVDDYVNCGNGASLNITSRITVALWVKSTIAPAQYDALLMKTSSTSWTNGYGLFYNSSSQMRFFVSSYSANVAFATINSTQWNHVAGVFDGSAVRIYVNGVEGTADPYTGAITSTTANLEIGRGASNLYNFNGLIDEVRIYNRALSAAEIAELARPDATPPTTPGSPTATAGGERVNLSWTAANDPESGISGYKIYRGTSSGGETFLTQIGNVTSYTDASTFPATTYFYQVSAVNGAGLEGSKSNEASALTGNNPPATPTGLTATAGNQQVTLDWNNNSEPDLAGYHVYRATTSGGPYTKITSSLVTASAYTDAGLTNGVRYYYVVTAQDQSGNESGNSSEANATPNNIDPSLVGYWRLDEGSGTTAADASGNSNHGTLVGGPSWSAGQFAGALSFDGVDDYVNCGNGASLNITSRITVALWVKSASLPAQYDALLMKTNSTSWTNGYGLFYNSSNQVRFFVSHWSANVASATITSPTQWNHIAGVFDGSSVRIYVNGVEGTSDPYTGAITSTTASLAIGRGASNLYNFNGLIDEACIYNRALSAAEIQALASGAASKRSTSEPDVDSPENLRPQNFHLAQNYPNPFNPTTIIRYELPEPVHVKLVIYDIVGRKIRTLVDAVEPAGFRQVIWDGANEAGARVPSGSYVIRMEAGTYAITRKVMMMK